MRILRALAAVTLAALAVLVPAIPASAALDPRCTDIFEVQGVIEVRDTDTAAAGLAPQITLDDLSCIVVLGAQPAYLYLDDPFDKLGTMLTAFAADDWAISLVDLDGSTTPFDLASLPGYRGSTDLTLMVARGADGAALYYSSDPESSAFFAAGLFVIADPLVGGAPTAAGTGADVPSTISELRTIAESVPGPAQTGVLVVTASALTALLGIPAFLLSRVFSARADQWFGWLGRGAVGRLRQRIAGARDRRRWPLLVAGILVAAFIACFIDPRFGLNPLSLRLYVTLVATFALFNIGGWAVLRLVLRRVDATADPRLTFHPATIPVVALAVLVSRTLGFDPGIVFGLVAGVTFAVSLALSREALVVLVGSGYAAGVAVLAWVGYSLLGTPTHPVGVALSETLGGITLEGVSTLPLALVPLATLDGATLFRFNRWVWGAVYAAGVALFTMVLFTIPGASSTVDGGFVRWAALFAVFALVAVVVWSVDAVLARRTARAPAATMAEDAGDRPRAAVG